MFKGKIRLLQAALSLGLSFLTVNPAWSDPWDFSNSTQVSIRNTAMSSTCKGTRISEDLVLTAAHCVANKNSGLAMPRNIFVDFPQNETGRPFLVKDIGVSAEYPFEKKPSLIGVANDLALLRLSSPIIDVSDTPAKIPFGRMDVVLYDEETEASQRCEGRLMSAKIMRMDCMSRPGKSGSPVYAVVAGKRRIVAVLSSLGKSNSGDSVTFAVPVFPLMNEIVWQSSLLR